MHACSWCANNCVVIAVVTTRLADATARWHWARTAHAVSLAFPPWLQCGGWSLDGGYSCGFAKRRGIHTSVGIGIGVSFDVSVGVSVGPFADARHSTNVARPRVAVALTTSAQP